MSTAARLQKTKPRVLRGFRLAVGESIELLDDRGGYKAQTVTVHRRARDQWEVRTTK